MPRRGNKREKNRHQEGYGRLIPACGEQMREQVHILVERCPIPARRERTEALGTPSGFAATHPRTQGTNHPKAEVVVGQVDPSPCAGNERPHHRTPFADAPHFNAGRKRKPGEARYMADDFVV